MKNCKHTLAEHYADSSASVGRIDWCPTCGAIAIDGGWREPKEPDPISDEEILEKFGWEMECESPFEIRHKDGSFATQQAAEIVLLAAKDGWLDEEKE